MLNNELLEKLKDEYKVIQCNTLEEGYELLNTLKALGWCWLNNASLDTTFYWENSFETHGNRQCFQIRDNKQICLIGDINKDDIISYSSLLSTKVISFVEEATKGIDWSSGYVIGKTIEAIFENEQQRDTSSLAINKIVLQELIKGYKLMQGQACENKTPLKPIF